MDNSEQEGLPELDGQEWEEPTANGEELIKRSVNKAITAYL